MAKIGPVAQQQINNLAAHYRRINRPAAVRNLRAAVATVLRKIDQPDTRSRQFPATYSGLAALNMSWIREHDYWFSYGKASDGTMTIANVIYDRNDIPAHAQPFQETVIA
jgi:plasmid stabilization system protein ParE